MDMNGLSLVPPAQHGSVGAGITDLGLQNGAFKYHRDGIANL